MKRHVLAAIAIIAIALMLAGCPGQGGMNHRPPPTIIIHK